MYWFFECVGGFDWMYYLFVGVLFGVGVEVCGFVVGLLKVVDDMGGVI